MTKETSAAVLERDAEEARADLPEPAARASEDLALRHHVPADRSRGARANVDGFVIGPELRHQLLPAASRRTERPKSDPCGRDIRQAAAGVRICRRPPRSFSTARSAFWRASPSTFFGLLLVTFLIGRVVPIDPVLAVVGDRAPADVYERVRIELGLDQPLWQQFVIYVGEGAARRFRHLGPDLAAGARPTSAASFRRRSSSPPSPSSSASRSASRWASSRRCIAGRWPDHLVRVARPGRLFGAGLLARAGGAAAVLRASSTGSPGPGGSMSSTRTSSTPVTGVILIDACIAGELGIFGNALRHI